ncbi:MAG: hypothetical protein ACO34J_05110, partial [Prochlorothrix sp.]
SAKNGTSPNSPSSAPFSATQKVMQYELWQSIEGSYAFFPADNVSARALLEPDDRLIWTVEANSWE